MTPPAISGSRRLRFPAVLSVALLALSLLAPSASAAAEKETADAHIDWLHRINDASRDLNYRGTFVYRHGTQIESLHIVHRVSDGDVRERLYSLSGGRREVIRKRGNVWCYIPKSNTGFRHYPPRVEGSFPGLLTYDIAHIGKFYNISGGERGRVAGYQARRLALMSRDAYRYGYLLWPEVDSGLLLRMDLLGETGKPLETYMFASVDINDTIEDSELLPETPDDELVWVEARTMQPLQADSEDAHWRVTDMPPGFYTSNAIHRSSPVNVAMMEHLVLSDGLAVVSVFVEPLQHADRKVRGLSRMGAVHAYGRVIGNSQVTVVGEVPALTVRMIGDSVERAAHADGNDGTTASY